VCFSPSQSLRGGVYSMRNDAKAAAFFYGSDVLIFIEMVLRELRNLPKARYTHPRSMSFFPCLNANVASLVDRIHFYLVSLSLHLASIITWLNSIFPSFCVVFDRDTIAVPC
jgi:hypothetical protein